MPGKYPSSHGSVRPVDARSQWVAFSSRLQLAGSPLSRPGAKSSRTATLPSRGARWPLASEVAQEEFKGSGGVKDSPGTGKLTMAWCGGLNLFGFPREVAQDTAEWSDSFVRFPMPGDRPSARGPGAGAGGRGGRGGGGLGFGLGV